MGSKTDLQRALDFKKTQGRYYPKGSQAYIEMNNAIKRLRAKVKKDN